MKYVIFFQGADIGSLTMEPDGLYYRISARCAEPGAGVWRLWGCFGTESRPMGVCFPETGGLRLEKRISRHSCPILPDAFVLGQEQAGFRPWRGILEGHEIPDAMLREEGEQGQTLAVFTPPEGPVPLAEYVSLMREQTLCNRPCLLLPLPDGLPALPVEEAPEPAEEAKAPVAQESPEAPEPPEAGDCDTASDQEIACSSCSTSSTGQ